ncbi:MAG: hypothetical protein Q9165_008753 [Trypethelium subeluteriae]
MRHTNYSDDSGESGWIGANHESIYPIQETCDERDVSSHQKKHPNDDGSESSSKRRRGEFQDYPTPTSLHDSTDLTTLTSSQTADPTGLRNNVVTARQSTSLPDNQPQTWQIEMILVDSVRLGDVFSLLGHVELPKIMGALRRLNVSAAFNRRKGAIILRGAQSSDDLTGAKSFVALKRAKSLLQPLLVSTRSLLPSSMSSTVDAGPRTHRCINRKFRPKKLRNNPTCSIEILPIDRSEDEDAVITWQEFIDPQLSDICRRARIKGSYTAALVRQKDAQNDATPVIRFQPVPQADVTRNIIRKSVKTICSENDRPELPIYFYNGTMKTLVGGSFADDHPDELIIPHQSRYYQRPGMSTSIGTGHCEHFYATLGGYIQVGAQVFMLTARHFMDDAHGCRDCDGTKTHDDSVYSPSLFDVKELGQVFEEQIQAFDLQIEDSEAVPTEDDVDLSALMQAVSRDQLILVNHYRRWREDLSRDRNDYKLGKLVESSAENAHAAPFYPRRNADNVKLHCMDWAIFEVDAERLGKNRFRYPRGIEPNCQHFDSEAGSVEGIGESCEASREFRPGEMVYYVGSNSGYREGTIHSEPILCVDRNGAKTHEWSIIPSGQDDVEVDDVQGDSGAWIVAKSDDHLLGLLWGFNGRLLFFTPIQEIFKHISSMMDGAHVKVAPLGSAPAVPLLLQLVSGNKRHLRRRPRALANAYSVKRLSGKEEARAKPRYYAKVNSIDWPSSKHLAVLRTTTSHRSMSIFSTSFREVLKRTGSKTDDTRVEVTPQDSPPYPPLLITPIRGTRRRIRMKSGAFRDGGPAMKLFNEAQERIKSRYNIMEGCGIWPSIGTMTAPTSGLRPSNPPSLIIHPYNLPLGACNFETKLEKPLGKSQPFGRAIRTLLGENERRPRSMFPLANFEAEKHRQNVLRRRGQQSSGTVFDNTALLVSHGYDSLEMSFGVGVGDILTIISLLYEVTEKCVNAPQLTKDTTDVLNASIAMLTELNPLTDAYFTLHPEDDKLRESVETYLGHLQNDVKGTQKLVEKWGGGWLLDSVVLPLKYTSKIEDKVKRIREHNNQIGQFVQVLNSKQLLLDLPAANAQNAADVKAAFARQEKMLNDVKEEIRKKDQEAREKDQMLQALLEKYGQKEVIQAACSDDPHSWKIIEVDLAKSDTRLTPSDAQKVLEPYKKEIKSRKLRMAAPILCVDIRQGALATMAQFHLEYLRLHAATGSRNFLIKRIEGAGYRLKSDLTRRATEAKAVPFDLSYRQVGAQRALDCVESAYGEEAKALELVKLTKLLRNDKFGRGVQSRHFRDCDYILCFDNEAFTALTKLIQYARRLEPASDRDPFKAQIILLPVSYSSNRVPQAFSEMKTQITAFVRDELDWSPPANLGAPRTRIWHNPYRARQFLIPSDTSQQKDGNKYAVHKAAGNIKSKTGCVMLMAYWQGLYLGTLVTIVGPKDAIWKAEEMVKSVCG